MAGETILTVVGNLTSDPELRFTPNGAAVTKFRIASTPRSFDKASGEFKDGEPLFLSCSVWQQQAENVAESLVRGQRVIVTGRLSIRSYETKEGEKRSVTEIQVDEVGPALRYGTAVFTKGGKGGGAPAAKPARQAPARQAPARQAAPAADPWADEPAF